MNAIIKPAKPFDIDQHILAMWLMFCRAPRRAEPDADGMYDLSEIGDVRAKSWERLNPYAVATPK